MFGLGRQIKGSTAQVNTVQLQRSFAAVLCGKEGLWSQGEETDVKAAIPRFFPVNTHQLKWSSWSCTIPVQGVCSITACTTPAACHCWRMNHTVPYIVL